MMNAENKYYIEVFWENLHRVRAQNNVQGFRFFLLMLEPQLLNKPGLNARTRYTLAQKTLGL